MSIAGNINESGGSFGITKTGPGTLNLSGTNTYSGGTTVLAGVLQVDSADALPDGTSLTVAAGGVFVFDPGQATSSGSAVEIAAVPAVAGGQTAAGSAAVAASPSVAASPGGGDAVLPLVVPGGKPAATVANGDYMARQAARQVENLSYAARHVENLSTGPTMPSSSRSIRELRQGKTPLPGRLSTAVGPMANPTRGTIRWTVPSMR